MPVKVLKISEPDYFLVGISSHQSDYKVSWAINNALKINLTAEEEYFSIQSTDNLLKEFSKFTFEEEESLFYYCLVSNLCENGYLIPKLKNIDFLLKISETILKARRIK